MELINKSRGTGKTTQLIYASAVTGFRIITSTSNSAKYIEGMAKTMGLKIPKPMSDVIYGHEKHNGDHTPILIDELPDRILGEALELYFDAPVAAATMTVPIDSDCVPHSCVECENSHMTMQNNYCRYKINGNCYSPVIMADKISEDCPLYKSKKTNRDVLNETFGHLKFKMDIYIKDLGDAITIETEEEKNLKFTDWLDQPYIYKGKIDG